MGEPLPWEHVYNSATIESQMCRLNGVCMEKLGLEIFPRSQLRNDSAESVELPISNLVEHLLQESCRVEPPLVVL